MSVDASRKNGLSSWCKECRIYRDQKAFSHDLNTITEQVLKWEILHK